MSNLLRAFQESDALSAVEIEGFLLLLLSEVMQRKDPRRGTPRWLRQAEEIIRDRFRESLTLTELAESVGVHPVWLASDFQRCFHQTVGQMIRLLRVEYASRELTETDELLMEVALRAGFSDQSHFSNVFHRLTGMTPRQFRLAGRSR